MAQDDSSKIIGYLTEDTRKNRLRLSGLGVMVGVAAGTVTVFYRVAMAYSAEIREFMLNAADGWLIPFYFALLFVMALVVAALIKWEPYIAGSGIPQVEGELKGYFDMPWLKVIIGKLVGSLLCIVAGLSVGREGPSVQLGAMAGKGVSRVLKQDNLQERYLITCGASAGLSAAFNCPLSGVVFALEEMHKDYSITMIFSAMAAAVSADFVSKWIFGMSPVFHIPLTASLELKYIGHVLFLGLLIGVAGVLFNRAMFLTQKCYDKIPSKIPKRFHPIIPFMLAGVMGFVMPVVQGDGHNMLEILTGGGLGLKIMLVYFVVKFVFSMICFASGAPGGSLAPMMVLGAYVGGIYAHFVMRTAGLDVTLINNFVILAMAGYFAAICRAPLTAVVLAVELTGSLNHLVYTVMVVFVAELVASLFKSEPLFDALLHKMVSHGEHAVHPVTEGGASEKTLVNVTVSDGALLDDTAVSEIMWPETCLAVEVRRDGDVIIPHGGTVLHAGDRITLLCDRDRLGHIKEELAALTETGGAAKFHALMREREKS